MRQMTTYGMNKRYGRLPEKVKQDRKGKSIDTFDEWKIVNV